MKWLKWFLAGAAAVPLFHQTALALLRLAGMTQRRPWSLAATEPFGVPTVISLSFWGGLWGVILGFVLLRVRHSSRVGAALLFGASAPTLVAGFVVAPLKGQPAGSGGDMKLLVTGILINAAWGIGTLLLARAMRVKV